MPVCWRVCVPVSGAGCRLEQVGCTLDSGQQKGRRAVPFSIDLEGGSDVICPVFCQPLQTGCAYTSATTLAMASVRCSRRMQVPAAQQDAASAAARQRWASFQQEYGLKEPALAITAEPAATPPAACLTSAAGQQLVDLLLTLPHGVVKSSHAVEGENAWVLWRRHNGYRAVLGCRALWTRRAADVSRRRRAGDDISGFHSPRVPPPFNLPGSLLPGLVETSTNLASIKAVAAGNAGPTGKAVFAVQCSTRSSLMPALEQVGVRRSWV